MPAIQLYNTLTRTKEPLQPLKAGAIGMYVCGVTPYDDCHIGHLMGPVVFDAIARWLRARGLAVRFVNNITDIDDKIIDRAKKTGEAWDTISKRYTEQYFAFLKRLHIGTITDYPRCTDYIPQMVAYIQDLIARDRAYVAGDGVYYDVQKQPGYGKLSGRKLDEMIAGSRIGRDELLRHPADFALWKLAKPDEPSWPSPWGAGRPGWHIECSVMSRETLGETFDIHGGGDDLKFPHHENEIAQGEAHGGEYAHCWMHNGLIQYEGVKVGKSDPRMKDPAFAGRFKAAHLLDTYGAATIRFLLLQGHYRRPSDFAEKALTAARTALGRLHGQLGASMAITPYPLGGEAAESARLESLALPATLAAHRDAFFAAMDDDFGTGVAIASLFSIATEARKLAADEHLVATTLVRDLGRLIGLFQPGDARDTSAQGSADGGSAALDGVMALILELRQQARANRVFAVSDQIRDALTKAGIAVKDAKDGATWERGGPAEAALDQAMTLVVELRQRARTDKDFATSDRIRDALAKAGIAIADSKDGATWSQTRFHAM